MVTLCLDPKGLKLQWRVLRCWEAGTMDIVAHYTNTEDSCGFPSTLHGAWRAVGTL